MFFFKPLEIGQYWENILAQEVEHVKREIGNYQQYNPEVQHSERWRNLLPKESLSKPTFTNQER